MKTVFCHFLSINNIGHPTAPPDIATDPSGSGDNIPRSSQHTTSSSHQGYYVPLTNDDDKYTRKNPLQAVGRWYRSVKKEREK